MIWICKRCKVHWYHPVEKCIYCGKEVSLFEPKTFKVKGTTEVFIPSSDHKTVPYFSLLLEDEQGNYHVNKTYANYKIGDKIRRTITKSCRKGFIIGIIGTGALGKDITKVMLQTGFNVILKSRSDDSLKKAHSDIETYLAKNFEEVDREKFIKNLKLTVNLIDLKNADLVIECVIENLEVKRDLLRDLEKVCSKKTIFATNTSSLSINELASQLENPERLVGMHFFNPATKMQLVEIVKGHKTSKKVVNRALELVNNIKKVPVVVNDSPSFIVNRILMPYLNEAVYVLKEGVAKKEDIDIAAKLALNHPMGPLQLLDLIGIDVFAEIMENLYRMTDDPKYKPCPLVEEMISRGKLGRKTGEGFYKYEKPY